MNAGAGVEAAVFRQQPEEAVLQTEAVQGGSELNLDIEECLECLLSLYRR